MSLCRQHELARLVAAFTTGLGVRGKGERQSEVGSWPWSARGYCQWAGDGSPGEEDEGKGGRRRRGCRNGGNGLQCKWPYQVLSLSGAVNSLGSERVVKANAAIWAGCRKISLSLTPSRGFFSFPSSALTFLPEIMPVVVFTAAHCYL